MGSPAPGGLRRPQRVMVDLAWSGVGRGRPLGRLQGPPQVFIPRGSTCSLPGSLLSPCEKDLREATLCAALSLTYFTDVESEASRSVVPEAVQQ